MARVGVGQRPVLVVVKAEIKSSVFFGGSIGVHLPVQLRDQIRRREPRAPAAIASAGCGCHVRWYAGRQLRPHNGLQRGHQQRR